MLEMLAMLRCLPSNVFEYKPPRLEPRLLGSLFGYIPPGLEPRYGISCPRIIIFSSCGKHSHKTWFGVAHAVGLRSCERHAIPRAESKSVAGESEAIKFCLRQNFATSDGPLASERCWQRPRRTRSKRAWKWGDVTRDCVGALRGMLLCCCAARLPHRLYKLLAKLHLTSYI